MLKFEHNRAKLTELFWQATLKRTAKLKVGMFVASGWPVCWLEIIKVEHIRGFNPGEALVRITTEDCRRMINSASDQRPAVASQGELDQLAGRMEIMARCEDCDGPECESCGGVPDA